MAIFELQHIALSGIAAAVPKQTESNWEYDAITEAERKLLIKTTGVEERRVVNDTTTTSDLCAEAARQLLEKTNTSKEEIEVLIFVSQSCDYYLPATAITLQDRLGLSKNTVALDIGLGCSGYVYGLSVISSMMQAMNLKKGLLLVGDVSTIMCSKDDKSTYPLFGDAGTATLLESTNQQSAAFYNLMSDGSGYQSIIVPDGGMRHKLSPESFEKKEISKGIARNRLSLVLDGMEVFNFAIGEVPKSIRSLHEKFGLTTEEVDYFVMHQANKLMNETIRKKLKIDPHKTPYSIGKFGNTSSASIPLTMVTEIRDELESKPLNLLLSGFGVGLSWGNVRLKTNKITCLPLIEM